MPEDELSAFLLAIFVGLLGGLVGVVSLIIWHVAVRQPIIARGQPISSLAIVYVGMVGCVGAALMCFLLGMPLFGTFFVVASAAYVVALIAYKRGWIR